jgi:hypothetical protein
VSGVRSFKLRLLDEHVRVVFGDGRCSGPVRAVSVDLEAGKLRATFERPAPQKPGAIHVDRPAFERSVAPLCAAVSSAIDEQL